MYKNTIIQKLKGKHHAEKAQELCVVDIGCA
jgi:hypothetical protein